MSNAAQVSKLYKTVVEDVITNVKEAFLDEGVDEQVLLELKQLWDSKLSASKALEPPPSESDLVLGAGNVMMLPQPVQQQQSHQIQGAGATIHVNNPQLAAQTQQIPIQANQLQFQPSAAATAAMQALPGGIIQQQLATIGAGGQIQNIAVQQTGTGNIIHVFWSCFSVSERHVYSFHNLFPFPFTFSQLQLKKIRFTLKISQFCETLGVGE